MHVISEVLLLKRDVYLFQAKKGQQMIEEKGSKLIKILK